VLLKSFAEFIAVAMKMVDAFRDDFAFEILPGASSDAVSGVDGCHTIHGGLVTGISVGRERWAG
jgi:hypothetical protein